METPSCVGMNKTVLVVEDNIQAAKVISMNLTEAGYQVVLASSGEDALGQAAQLHPLAILLDILLPSMDGWEVLARLKASLATRDIPVVILSVLERQTLGFRLGATDYLVKPVDRTQLLRALGRCELHAKHARRSLRIMVVDDNAEELSTIADMLYRQGYDVLQALGEKEGAYLARASRPDMVVLGLLLSGADYAAAVADLEGSAGALPIPILVLSATHLPLEQSLRLRSQIQDVIVNGGNLEATLLAAIGHIFEEMETPADEEH